MDPCSEEFDDFDDFLSCFHDCDPEVTECMDANCPGGVSVTITANAGGVSVTVTAGGVSVIVTVNAGGEGVTINVNADAKATKRQEHPLIHDTIHMRAYDFSHLPTILLQVWPGDVDYSAGVRPFPRPGPGNV